MEYRQHLGIHLLPIPLAVPRIRSTLRTGEIWAYMLRLEREMEDYYGKAERSDSGGCPRTRKEKMIDHDRRHFRDYI